ncbi:UNVERIFIED_CONTAM: phospho-sugar mutase, partial [Escherichia coli]
PNPEDPNAFTLAFELADKIGANVALATDPDSDRLGVAVRTHDGSFRVLTGNQIGSLLLHYILSSLGEKNALPPDGLV